VIKLDQRNEGEKESEVIRESVEVPKADLEKHGYTSKCAGCRSVLRKTARQGHSIECRERLKGKMAKESKVIETEEREMQFHEKVYADMQDKLHEKTNEPSSNADEAEEERSTKKARKEEVEATSERARSSGDPEGSVKEKRDHDLRSGEKEVKEKRDHDLRSGEKERLRQEPGEGDRGCSD